MASYWGGGVKGPNIKDKAFFLTVIKLEGGMGDKALKARLFKKITFFAASYTIYIIHIAITLIPTNKHELWTSHITNIKHF